MQTLKQNYGKNIEILKENLRRGLSLEKATQAINGMENQFKNADKYGENEKDFINEMRKITIEYFSTLKINIVK